MYSNALHKKGHQGSSFAHCKIARVMQLTTILLIAACVQVSAHVHAQPAITISENNASLKKIFEDIKQQTGYSFIYTKEDLNKASPVSIHVKAANIHEVLDHCFRNQPLTYLIKNDIIVVRSVPSGELVHAPPPTRVTGEVRDSSTGQPLAGVTVQVRGSTVGAVTDAQGRFALEVPDNAVLEVSYIGYTTRQIPVNGRTVFDIALMAAATGLNQLVVVGYGTQEKKDLTGAVSVVDVGSVKAQPAASVTEALQGKAAGVNIVNDGSPGSTPQIRIRGYSTVNNNDPLYIIDGVPYEGNLAWLNQNDVESIQVLKDASSASIYGSRANNGVVIITTKKGQQGALSITFDAHYGSSVPIRSNFPQFLSPMQYATYLFQSYNNAGLDPGASLGIMYGHGSDPQLPTYLIAGNAAGIEVTDADADPAKYNHDPENFYQITKANQHGTDWMRAITRNAPSQSYQLGASGGSEHAVYALSLGYLNQQGIVKYTSFKRYNIRSNIQFKAFHDRVRFGENMVFSRTEGIGFATNVGSPGGYQQVYSPIGDVYKIQPIIPIYDIEGNFAGARGPTLGDAKNPLALLYRAKDNYTHQNRLFGNVYGEVDILKELTARTSFGVNLNNSNGQNIRYPSMEDAASVSTNGYSASQGYTTQWTWSNTLNYKRVFHQRHSVSLLIGSEANYSSNRNLSGSRNGYFILGDQNYYYLNTGSENIQNSETGSLSTLFSLFGRVDYSLDGKYLFSATLRRDGSSKFGSLNKYGLFPSFSAAWRISDEQFMKGVDWIDDLKIRVGYGETGNQNIPSDNAYDLFTPLITTSSYPMNGSGSLASGVSQSQIGNPSLEWERLKSTNIGLDFTLLNGALDGSVDVYKRVTSGMLFSVPLLDQVGGMANSPFTNVGSMQNKGIEISLNYHHSSSDQNTFQWDAGVNISHNSNKILELAPGITHTLYGTGELTTTILEEGEPYGEFYGYKQAGIFQNKEEVDASTQPGARLGGMKYADVNGDGEFSSDDRTTLGSPLPKFTYGINLAASYKHFDVLCFFYGSQGNKLYNEPKLFTDFQYFPSAASTRLLHPWSPSNSGSKVPAPSALSTPLEYESSSYYVEDGSYFRMKNLQVGYTFLHLFKGISSLRIYGSVTNLFTITKYSGLDPEVSQYNTTVSLPGLDLGVYPVSRQFIAGINVKF
jgi:TonB-linked SusC/RagA family outer membrane protein